MLIFPMIAHNIWGVTNSHFKGFFDIGSQPNDNYIHGSGLCTLIHQVTLDESEKQGDKRRLHFYGWVNNYTQL